MRLSVLTTVALLFLPYVLLAQSPFAGQRFALESYDDINEQTFRENYSEALRQLPSRAKTCTSCEFGHDRDFAHVRPMLGEHKTALPFAAALPVYEDTWAPADSAADSTAAIEFWTSHRDSGEAFDCEESDVCTVIVDLIPPAEGGKLLGSCKIIRSSNILGAPLRCRPVVWVSSTTTWISVVAPSSILSRDGFMSMGFTQRNYRLGLPDFTLRLESDWPINFSLARQSIENALRRPNLDYIVEYSDGDDHLHPGFIAKRMYKVSKVFGPSREIQTLQIALDAEPLPPTFSKANIRFNSLSLTLSSTLFINEQNTSPVTDWHMATDEQTDRLVEMLKGRLKTTLESLCGETVSWIDKTGTCQHSR